MLAVFSEVYYNSGKGWQAYIDGEPVEHFRVNWILRGMVVPAGTHLIEYKFEPRSYYTGEKIALASSILVLLAFAGGIGLTLYKQYKGEGMEEEEQA